MIKLDSTGVKLIAARRRRAYYGQTLQPYSSTLMHGYEDFPTRILTYLALTGVNVFNTGVK